jgi:hypothetical protein
VLTAELLARVTGTPEQRRAVVLSLMTVADQLRSIPPDDVAALLTGPADRPVAAAWSRNMSDWCATLGTRLDTTTESEQPS